MPTVAGTVRQGPLSTFVYSHLAGSTRSVEELSAGSAGAGPGNRGGPGRDP